MFDEPGDGGTVILAGTVLSGNPFVAMGHGAILDGGPAVSMNLNHYAGSAAILYDQAPVAEAHGASPAGHGAATNAVQLLQAQLAAAYGEHNAAIAMHGDWSLIAGDAHSASDSAAQPDTHFDAMSGAGYFDDGFHPLFDNFDMFGFADHGHHVGFDLFAVHVLTVDDFM